MARNGVGEGLNYKGVLKEELKASGSLSNFRQLLFNATTIPFISVCLCVCQSADLSREQACASVGRSVLTLDYNL